MLSNLDSGQLRQLLVTSGFLTALELDQALAEARTADKELHQVIVAKNWLTPVELTKLLAAHLGWSFIDLSQIKIAPEVLGQIPELTARRGRCLAFACDRSGLHVAFADPLDKAALASLSKKLDQPIMPFAALPEQVDEALTLYDADNSSEFKILVERALTEVESEQPADSIKALAVQLMTQASRNKVSDIHLEPYEDRILVSYRLDGSFHHIIDLPKVLADPLLERLKAMASQQPTDILASFAPTTTGQKVILRLLNHKNRALDLPSLGFNQPQLRTLRTASQRRQGLIVASGPPGCGKTTTLYALLKELNQGNLNIASIEDPVEYDIEGIHQIQVNKQTGLTFATGLEALLRQDPDVIMVGELGEVETAALTTGAALTDQLVLTSVPVTDAAAAISYLLAMEVEPILLANALDVVIGQRLVRKICANCRVSYTVSASELEIIAAQLGLPVSQLKPRFYRGRGCQTCGRTGFQGRLGLFEVLKVSGQIKKLIKTRATAVAIKAQAVSEGMVSLTRDGALKAQAGLTTVEELISQLES